MKKILIFITLLSLFLLTGCSGKSSYDLAVDNGFIGTIEEYLDSLKGEDSSNITIEELFNFLVEKGDYKSDEYTLFLSDYLNDYLKDVNNEEVVINNTLLSSVSIQTTFNDGISSGSGVIYELDQQNGDAYIVTNYHVIRDIEDENNIPILINVFLYGYELNMYAIKATVVGYMKSNDLAVLKIKNSNILKNTKYIEAVNNNAETCFVGDSAYVVGNALGLGISATKGIISVESEYISIDGISSIRVMRVDASINRGNSGGGLFNKYGQLIGIVNAKIISSGVESIGYVIPISTVKGIVDNIIRNQSNVVKVIVGLTLSTVGSYIQYNENLKKYYITETLQVTDISSNSVCTDLKKGDILSSVEYKGTIYKLERDYILGDLLYFASQYDSVKINYYRNGILNTTDVILTSIIYY